MSTLVAAFPRVSARDRASAGLELGVEPPIRLGDDRLDRHERRRTSLRWLIGAALTGLSGVVLIGAALYFDLDSQSNFAEAPEYAAGSPTAEGAEEGVSAGKGDRLLRPVDIVADKQTFTIPVTIKVGDKEVIKPRTFTRLQTALSLTPNEFAGAAPPFNPLKLMNRAETADIAPDPGPVQDDAEVSFQTRDLTAADAEQATGDLTLAEAQAQVVVTLKAPPDVPKTPSSLPAQLLLMRTTQAAPDPLDSLSSYATVGAVQPSAPFASIEVRMIPENVTNVAKSSPEDATPTEKVVQLHHGESFDSLLKANGANSQAAAAILAAFGAKPGELPVAEGQKILLLPEEAAVRGAKPRIARVSVYADGQLKATVALTDDGDYKPVMRGAQPPRKAKNSDSAKGPGSAFTRAFMKQP